MAKLKPRDKRLTPQQFSEAIAAAQKQLNAAEEPGQQVALKVKEIETRTDLFQPRGFYLGVYELDKQFVKKLAHEIRIRGELEPLLVIKLGSRWVILDGHHRLEAYKHLEWQEPLNCDWFAGSVREAVDESVRRNSVIKLPMDQPDKFEQAWKRTVLSWPWGGGSSWSSKSQVCKLCGVSDGTVAKMRRVVTRYYENSAATELLQERLGAPLKEVSWGRAHAAWLNLEKKTVDEQAQAAKLARLMRSRFADRLSSNPALTARALAIYDPDLPEPLQQYLHEELQKQSSENDEGPREVGGTIKDLERRLLLVREQERELLAELERRKAAGETPSDATWAAWVEDTKSTSGPKAA
jgi:ParB-like nuclease domain